MAFEEPQDLVCLMNRLVSSMGASVIPFCFGFAGVLLLRLVVVV